MTHQPKHHHQEEIVFLRGEHPDPLTDAEWVTLMITKGFNWPHIGGKKWVYRPRKNN